MRARAPSATVEQKGARGRVSYVHRACIEARRTYLCFCSASGVTMPIPIRGRRAVVDGCVDSTGEGRPCMHTNDLGGREGRIAGEQLRKAQRRRLSSPPAHAGRAQ